MSEYLYGRAVTALLLTFSIIIISASVEARSVAGKTINRKSKNVRKPASRPVSSCNRCTGRSAAKSKARPVARKAKQPASCYPKGYVDPKIAKNLNAAVRDMRRAGIKPVITSTWRSSKSQEWLHDCSNSSKCRRRHPGLYRAMPPGRSLHEAGLAVDIAGVAAGPRGRKRLTPRGRRIVAIMRKHGFNWRYGMADPVHFEVDPRKYGYRNAQHAIQRSQSQCQVRLAAAKKSAPVAKRRNLQSQQAARAVKSASPQIRVTVKVDSPALKRPASRT